MNTWPLVVAICVIVGGTYTTTCAQQIVSIEPLSSVEWTYGDVCLINGSIVSGWTNEQQVLLQSNSASNPTDQDILQILSPEFPISSEMYWMKFVQVNSEIKLVFLINNLSDGEMEIDVATLNESFEIISQNTYSLGSNENNWSIEFRTKALSNSTLLVSRVNSEDDPPSIELALIDELNEEITTSSIPGPWLVPQLYFGYTIEEFGGMLHLGGMYSSTVLDPNLNVVSDYTFNHEIVLDSDYWRSYIFNSSTVFDDQLVIQGAAYLDELDPTKRDNLLWVLNNEGEVVDTVFIERPDLDEMTVHETIAASEDFIFLGSTFEDEFDSAIAKGTGMYFTLIDESYDVVWEHPVAEGDSVNYSLLKTGISDNHAFGIYEKFSIDSNVPQQSLELIVFDLNEMGVVSDQKETELIQAYPNPCNHTLSLSFKDPRDRLIEVFSSDGKWVLSDQCNACLGWNIDTQTLEEGSYLLRLISEGNVTSQSFVVRR